MKISKEIVRCALTYVGLSLSGCRIKLQESVFHEFVDFHDGCLVTASVAVVGSGENGDNVFFMSPIVATHHKLMGTRYQFKSIGMVELLGDVLTEGIASTSGRDTPAAAIIRIRP